MQPILVAQLLILLTVANGAPVVARILLGQRFAQPVDGGRQLPDGKRWLGDSKTWRGLFASLAVTPLTAMALQLPAGIGLSIAVWAMAGDLTSSFIKRRLGLRPHHSAPGLDQLPEALLPLLAVMPALSLSWTSLLLTLGIFTLLNLGATHLTDRYFRRRHRVEDDGL